MYDRWFQLLSGKSTKTCFAFGYNVQFHLSRCWLFSLTIQLNTSQDRNISDGYSLIVVSNKEKDKVKEQIKQQASQTPLTYPF